MQILDMELIIAIAQTGSISMAAKKLYKSQPNVSKELKDIEEKYNTKLFERSHKGVEITEAGKLFLKTAFKILDEIHSLTLINEEASKMPREFHICSIKYIYSLKAIQEWIDSLVADGTYAIHIHEDTVMDVIDNISKGKYSIGVISVPKKQEEYVFNLLSNNNIKYDHILSYQKILLMSKNHPLKDKEINDISDLSPYHEIILGSNSAFQASPIIKDDEHKKLVVYDFGSAVAYMEYLENAFVWTAPMPKYLLDYKGIMSKEYNFENEQVDDYIIFKETSKDLEITNSFISSIHEFIKKLKKDYKNL